MSWDISNLIDMYILNDVMTDFQNNKLHCAITIGNVPKTTITTTNMHKNTVSCQDFNWYSPCLLPSAMVKHWHNCCFWLIMWCVKLSFPSLRTLGTRSASLAYLVGASTSGQSLLRNFLSMVIKWWATNIQLLWCKATNTEFMWCKVTNIQLNVWIFHLHSTKNNSFANYTQ